jgi:hypothetical protein
VDNFDASYSYVANEGTAFTFKTNLNAPRYRCARACLAATAGATRLQRLWCEAALMCVLADSMHVLPMALHDADDTHARVCMRMYTALARQGGARAAGA